VAKGAWELTSGNGDGSAGTKIQVGRQNLNDGAVGVKVQVDGRPVAPRSTLLDLGPLFGRSEDLAAISEALKDPGKPARLILSGEPGIGKTHLANAYGQTSGHATQAGCSSSRSMTTLRSGWQN